MLQMNPLASMFATFFSYGIGLGTIGAAWHSFNEGQKALVLKYTDIYPETIVYSDKTTVGPGIIYFISEQHGPLPYITNGKDEAFGDFFDKVTDNMQYFAKQAWDFQYTGPETKEYFGAAFANHINQALDAVSRRMSVFV